MEELEDKSLESMFPSLNRVQRVKIFIISFCKSKRRVVGGKVWSIVSTRLLPESKTVKFEPWKWDSIGEFSTPYMFLS